MQNCKLMKINKLLIFGLCEYVSLITTSKKTWSSVNRGSDGKIYQSIEFKELVTVITSVSPRRAFL